LKVLANLIAGASTEAQDFQTYGVASRDHAASDLATQQNVSTVPKALTPQEPASYPSIPGVVAGECKTSPACEASVPNTPSSPQPPEDRAAAVYKELATEATR
jgi:hypothetical protein